MPGGRLSLRARARVDALARLITWLLVTAYGAEGLNLALRFLPTTQLVAALRRYGAEVGTDVRVKAPLTLNFGPTHSRAYCRNLALGDGCYVGRDCLLDLEGNVTVEEQVTVSHRVSILSHADAGNSPLAALSLPRRVAPVLLRRGSYIGAGAIILPGVDVGECAIVAAGAVVTQNVETWTAVAGIPARRIRILARVQTQTPVTCSPGREV